MRHGWLQGKNWRESTCMVCAEETGRNWQENIKMGRNRVGRLSRRAGAAGNCNARVARESRETTNAAKYWEEVRYNARINREVTYLKP